MNLQKLAKHLSDRERIGLTPELCDALGLAGEDATRGRLLAATEGVRGHLQVLLLGCFVVDDTDIFSDGEIYWWSVPVVQSGDGTVSKNVLNGLPNGMPPHKCGDQEWMTNLSLGQPPLLAVIPPGDDVSACVVRLAIYDDDRAPADLAGAVGAGIEVLAQASSEPLTAPERLIGPVRDAIFQHLKAEDDDILIDQDVVIRKGETSHFNAGMIGSVINAMARAYYFVRDTERTHQFGPVTLHRGQTEQVKFDVPIETGGRIAIFARGHDVTCPTFGNLTVDTAFINRVVSTRQDLNDGFAVTGTGPAKLVAYYTPSYAADGG
jgi:hypothetical protein